MRKLNMKNLKFVVSAVIVGALATCIMFAGAVCLVAPWSFIVVACVYIGLLYTYYLMSVHM